MIVELGADEADNKIVELINENDLAITADIPLANRILEKMPMQLIIEENFILKIILKSI